MRLNYEKYVRVYKNDLSDEVGSVNYKLNEEKNMSNLWSVDFKDVLKGLLTSVYGALITYLYGVFAGLYQLVINKEPFSITVDFKAMLVIGIFAGLSYLVTRYTSDTKGVLFGSNKK